MQIESGLKEKRYQYVMLMVCFICIFLYNIRFITKIEMPSIIVDEIGYLASGAFFRGWDWGDVMSSYSSYYSYGYGAFISFVFMIFGENMYLAYKALIIINALSVAISFLLANAIFSWFNTKNVLRIAICFLISFLPSVLHHVQFAWAETPLFLFFWIVSFLVFKYLNNHKIIYLFLSTIFLVSLYYIHQRALGVVISFAVLIVVLSVNGVVKKKEAIFIILSILALMILGSFVKTLVSNIVFLTAKADLLGTTDKYSVNSYSGQVEKILAIVSIEGIEKLFVSVLGKITYLGLESFLLGFEGLICCFYACKQCMKKSIARGKDYLIAFWGVSFLATLMIAAIFHIHPVRIDVMLYGRYTDWLIAPIIAIGILNNRDGWKKRIFIYFLLEAVCLICVNLFIRRYKLYSNFATCSPITFWFRNVMCNCELYWVSFMFALLIFASFILFYLFKQKKEVLKYSGMILILMAWCFLANQALGYDIHMGLKNECKEIAEYVLSEDNPVYYVFNEKGSMYITNIQYLLGGKKINVIDKDYDVNSLEPDSYIIEYCDGDLELENKELICTNNVFRLFQASH